MMERRMTVVMIFRERFELTLASHAARDQSGTTFSSGKEFRAGRLYQRKDVEIVNFSTRIPGGKRRENLPGAAGRSYRPGGL
jgi:hypothetical protein